MRERPEWDLTLESLHSSQLDRLPTNDLLKRLSHSYSVDLATLFLAHQIINMPENRFIQYEFNRNFSNLKSNKNINQAALDVILSNKGYLFLFVPGWFYKDVPGGDFAEPRATLRKLGYESYLTPIDENGTVEHNAKIIVNQVLKHSKGHKSLIVVSSSKGGADTALALTMLGQSRSAHKVRCWVNIDGILNGTKLADYSSQWPRSWYIKFFILQGKSLSAIDSMKTVRSRLRLNQVKIPEDILIINYITIPLSGNITIKAERGYSLLREDGPNDGITLVRDAIMPGGMTIIEFGMDHYYTHPDINLKTVALVQTILSYLNTANR